MIEVTAAVLTRAGRVLIARRRAGARRAGLWEFPGGKVEPGETPEEALAREWREELGVDVGESAAWAFASGAPNGRHVTLLVFLVRAARGVPSPRGVAELRWATPVEAGQLPLLPADRPLVERLARDGRGAFAATESGEPAP